MRQHHELSSLQNFMSCSRATRVLNPDRSMNRQNQLTIQPRASNRGRAILSILSIFWLARPHPKTMFDSLRSFSSLSVSLSLSLSLSHFCTNHPLSSLSPPRISYLSISLSTVKTRRCNTTKRVGTNSISRQKRCIDIVERHSQ